MFARIAVIQTQTLTQSVSQSVPYLVKCLITKMPEPEFDQQPII